MVVQDDDCTMIQDVQEVQLENSQLSIQKNTNGTSETYQRESQPVSESAEITEKLVQQALEKALEHRGQYVTNEQSFPLDLSVVKPIPAQDCSTRKNSSTDQEIYSDISDEGDEPMEIVTKDPMYQGMPPLIRITPTATPTATPSSTPLTNNSSSEQTQENNKIVTKRDTRKVHPYQCCNLKFKNKIEVDTHHKLFHGQFGSKVKYYECALCQDVSHNVWKLKAHLKSVHGLHGKWTLHGRRITHPEFMQLLLKSPAKIFVERE